MIRIDKVIWKEKFVDKIGDKHQVTVSEVEDILHGRKQVFRVTKGDVKGEDIYLALGKTNAGRYLSVFFILKKPHSVLPISVHDMDSKERRRYKHV